MLGMEKTGERDEVTRLDADLGFDCDAGFKQGLSAYCVAGSVFDPCGV